MKNNNFMRKHTDLFLWHRILVESFRSFYIELLSQIEKILGILVYWKDDWELL